MSLVHFRFVRVFLIHLLILNSERGAERNGFTMMRVYIKNHYFFFLSVNNFSTRNIILIISTLGVNFGKKFCLVSGIVGAHLFIFLKVSLRLLKNVIGHKHFIEGSSSVVLSTI